MSHTKKPTIEKIILALLGLLALAALVRTMFLGLEIDEEYALSLGFRLVRGDRLFYSMWEPHQLAALPPALLIGLFTALAGTTTGVLLFVRGAVLAVKLALAVWFYRSLRVALGGRCAYLLALAVLAFTPKWFLGPDYVSQQFHFTLAAFLFLYGYYAPGPRQYHGLWRVAAGGVCACLSFLAYPQTLAAAPVLMLALLLLGRGSADKCRGLWVFVLTCAVCGGAFVVYVLQGMGFDFAALLARADLILHDPQYDFTTADRLAMLRSQLSAVIGNCWLSALAGVALAAAGMLFGERRGFARSLEKALWYTAFFLSLWCTAYCLRAQELDFRYMCPAFALAGGWTFWCDRREAGHRPLRRLLFWLGWLPGIAAYLFILRSTLIALPTTFMYLFWPAVCGTAALLLKPRPTRRHRAAAALLAAGLLLACAVPKLCLVLETGWHCEPITAIQPERITRGPAAGTWADTKAADMQECLYEALAPYAGKSVLQAIGEQHGLGFLMADGTLTVAKRPSSRAPTATRVLNSTMRFCRRSSPTSSSTMMPRSATWPNSTPGSSSTLPSQTATPCSTARPVCRCSSSGNFAEFYNRERLSSCFRMWYTVIKSSYFQGGAPMGLITAIQNKTEQARAKERIRPLLESRMMRDILLEIGQRGTEKLDPQSVPLDQRPLASKRAAECGTAGLQQSVIREIVLDEAAITLFAGSDEVPFLYGDYNYETIDDTDCLPAVAQYLVQHLLGYYNITRTFYSVPKHNGRSVTEKTRQVFIKRHHEDTPFDPQPTKKQKLF